MGAHLVASLVTFFATLATSSLPAVLPEPEGGLPLVAAAALSLDLGGPGSSRLARVPGRMPGPGDLPDLRAVGGEAALLCAPGSAGTVDLDDVRWAARETGLGEDGGVPCLPPAVAEAPEPGSVVEPPGRGLAEWPDDDEPAAADEPGGGEGSTTGDVAGEDEDPEPDDTPVEDEGPEPDDEPHEPAPGDGPDEDDPGC